MYGLLGELVVSQDGRFLDLPGGHNLIVLAALLANANQRMAKSDLLRVAWGGEPVSEAQLHKSVAALRGLLDQLGRRDDLVTHTRYGYEIRVPAGDLDMLLFQQLLRDAEQARAERRADDETVHLRRALALWRGAYPLSNLPAGALRHERESLVLRRKRAAARLFDLELARGHHDRVLDDLVVMAGYYAADGRLCEQLMIVQYRSGHVTDAIGTYERHEMALREETGSDPDRALRDLCYAIASGDEPVAKSAEAVIVRRAGTQAAAGPRTAVPRELPPESADFAGRADLVAEAAWLLGRQPDRNPPVVVISGPGGIGKTALAVRVAHRVSEHYPDGQLYLELRRPPDQRADTSELLAQVLRAYDRTVPERLAERLAAYRTLLAGRRVLIVLDDAADGTQVRDLIPANPGCGILATSHQRLPEIDGAHHVPTLAPLGQKAATELFLRIVRGSGIDLRQDLDAVDRVVALCGGLPLALRIAAMQRVHDHPRPTSELADRLARQGPEAFTYREQSVARTIGAGFDRLDDTARRLFLGLGVLQLSSFGLWTAAALLDGSGVDPAVPLSELAASNMVELVEPQLRYRFHDLTREYAARRAYTGDTGTGDTGAGDTGAGERDVMLGRAYEALLTLSRRAHAALYGGDFEVIHSAIPDWNAPAAALAEVIESPLEWFEKERLNIRAAVRHCAELGRTGNCWDLAVSAHEFYTIAGYHDDWYETHTTALRACRDAGDKRGEGILLASLGQPALVASRRDGVSGLPELQRSADLLAECRDRHGQGIALRTLANALRRQGHFARPLQLFREALAHYEASGDTVGQWQTQRFIGQTHLDLGQPDAALRELRAAESIAERLGEPRLLGQTRYWIGEACLAAGDLDGAQACFAAMAEVFSEPTGLGHAYAVHGLGDVARLAGALSVAEQHLSLAASLARVQADANLEGRVGLSAAQLYGTLGQDDRRVAALEHAAACFADCNSPYLQVQALEELVRAQQDGGQAEAALAASARIKELLVQMDLPEADRVLPGPPGVAG
jgi:DNA-binding SARP family transcriptional activator/tetratricopeptide (TPR) repeat protein